MRLLRQAITHSNSAPPLCMHLLTLAFPLLERDDTRMSKGMREGAVFERGNASISKAMQGGSTARTGEYAYE